MGKVKDCLTSTPCLVYCSIALSAWGDLMWNFAIALFLIKLSPESLRLTAIYGLSCGGAVLLFCPIIGDWVDRNPRLYVARLTLICQNSFVALSAIIVFALFHWSPQIAQVGTDSPLIYMFQAGIIAVAVLARLAGCGNRISVQKDWILEICDRDKDKLAVMTSTIRRIYLLNKILAPLATGQILAFTSNTFACIFISSWNVVSMFLEYYLLWKVYGRVPALAQKVYKIHKKNVPETKPESDMLIVEEKGDKRDGPPEEESYESKFETECMEAENPYLECETKISENDKEMEQTVSESRPCCDYRRLFVGVSRLFTGWRTYMSYRVALVGMALSFLYMTVLGFDNITMGYAYSQGVSEWVLGVIMAVGAVVGINGTLAYPHIRRRVGLERTGLFSFTFHMLSLTLCVASVWAPGSPFDPLYYILGPQGVVNCTAPSNSLIVVASNYSLQPFLVPGNTSASPYGVYDVTTDIATPCVTPRAYQSIVLLLTGISLARFGLWVSDLTITQLQLENIAETERGVVNGVQLSLNMLMDMIKFALIIFLPTPPVFGYLILLSVVFGLCGFALYSCYTYRVRGHLLPHTLPCMKGETNGAAHAGDAGTELVGDNDDVNASVNV